MSGFLTEYDNETKQEVVVRYGDDYPMSWTLPCAPARPSAAAASAASPLKPLAPADQQNIDLMPADGQYPDDEHPKYCNMTKAEGGGYVAHGCHVWSNRAIGTFL